MKTGTPTQKPSLTAKEYLLNWLAQSAKTEGQARRKLTQKGYSEQQTDEAIAMAKEYNYLSDLTYAQNYISRFGEKKGKLLLKKELYERGIAENLINAALSDCDIDEYAACQAAADKYLNKKTDVKTHEKLCRHLAAKGFSFNAIYAVVKTDTETDVDE